MKENNNKKNKKHSKSAKGGDFSAAVVSGKDYSHIEPVQAKPLEVVVYSNSFDKALRAFRALVQKERILSNFKEKQRYEKPSDRKRRKRNEARRKAMEINSSRDNHRSNKKVVKYKKSNDSENE